MLKITKLDGEVIQDYSDNLRKKEDTFTWSDNIKAIVVYDKVGNSTVVDLRVPIHDVSKMDP